jgi:hypothetical protein
MNRKHEDKIKECKEFATADGKTIGRKGTADAFTPT